MNLKINPINTIYHLKSIGFHNQRKKKAYKFNPNRRIKDRKSLS